MINDVALNNETGDLYFTENGDLRLINGIYYVRQKISIRLKWFFQEWYLDETLGIPYFEKILIKNPNTLEIISYIKRQILLTDGVKEVTKFNLEFTGERTLAINFEAKTDYGKLIFSDIYTVT